MDISQKILVIGFIAGIDHSQIMLEQASRRNKEQIEKGKVKLECGTVWDLKYPVAKTEIREVANDTKTQYKEAGLTNIEIDFKKMSLYHVFI